jgi:hypothetical protein
MEHIFIANGQTQLVLVPENEAERLLLDKILSTGPVEVSYITQPVGILGKSVMNGIIIRKQHFNEVVNDTAEIESLQEL